MQNTNNSRERNEENPIFLKILEIISPAKKTDLQKLRDKYGIMDSISRIIPFEKTNKELALYLISELGVDYFKQFPDLHSDKQVVKTALLVNPNIYNILPDILKKDTEIWVWVVKSMVHKQRNFKEVEKFIESNFPEKKNFLFARYSEFLKTQSFIFQNDLNKHLFKLKTENKELFDKFEELWVVSYKWEKVDFNTDFLKSILDDLLKSEEYLNLDKKAKKEYTKKFLEKLFDIKIENLEKNEKYIFNKLLAILWNLEDKNKLANKKITWADNENEQEDIAEKRERKKREQKQAEAQRKKEKEIWVLIDYTYPDWNSYKVSWWYNIETQTWKTVFITDKEKDKFTSEALANFIKFQNTLYNLWLGFLWDKYSHDFKVLANNKFGFDYTSNEWITENKTLAILNMIWKNIWIPEQSVIDEDWKETWVVKCFKTLADAKMAFWEIKETGEINWKKYSDGSAFWNTAVYNKLIDSWLIDPKLNWLNISKWK